MNSRVYGSKEMIIDNTFTKRNKELGINVKTYRYSFFLKNGNEFSREFFSNNII